jgi:uncharacterized membrane-anchored protein
MIRLILILLAIAALTLLVLALADGPNVIEMIDNPKF